MNGMIRQLVMICLAVAAAGEDVRNCCRDGMIMHKTNLTCSDGDKIDLVCEDGYFVMESDIDSEYFSEQEGKFVFFDETDDDYCLHVENDNETSVPRATAVVCSSPLIDSLTWVSAVLMMISLPFLAVTIVIYSAIPTLRDLSGKCIIGYLISLAVSYIVIISRIFNPYSEFCALRGAFLFFSTISLFTWLDLVTFNVWKYVRNKDYQISDAKLFRLYLGWSVGIPVTLSIIVFILDMIPGTRFSGHFGMFDCINEDIMGFWVFLYTPMIILIVLNLVFFGHSSWILWRGYRDPNQARIRALRFKCLLTIRLFFLSGIPWTFEIISLLLEDYANLRYLWLIFDCVNSGQGFVVFLLLIVFHKRARRAIQHSNFLGIKWPESWGERDAESVSLSELDKVAMEQIKQSMP